jgi:hypothetical protein
MAKKLHIVSRKRLKDSYHQRELFEQVTREGAERRLEDETFAVTDFVKKQLTASPHKNLLPFWPFSWFIRHLLTWRIQETTKILKLGTTYEESQVLVRDEFLSAFKGPWWSRWIIKIMIWKYGPEVALHIN